MTERAPAHDRQAHPHPGAPARRAAPFTVTKTQAVAVQLQLAARGLALWLRIREPRVLRVVFWVGYAVTAYIGVMTLLNPPRTVEGLLGPVLSVSWSVFWIIGGLGGCATVLTGWWQAERTAALAAMFGLTIYGAVVLTLHFTQDGSRLTQHGVIVLAFLLFVIRLVLIRGHDFEPRR